MESIPDTWQDRVRRKRDVQAKALSALEDQEKLESFDSSLTDVDDVSAIASRIASGELTSETVTKAYIQKAIEAHKLTNCLTEIFFRDALDQARGLDAHLSKHGTVVGPLHGVPMSLKDQFNVQGYDSTLGYVGRTFAPASEDAVLVAMLKSLGAVILAKTNLPQSIMWCETENPLWGLTTHPRCRDYTPGGSTGGDAALLGLRGSLVGWGTDIGGSVRIPAHMMGLYGLKPSSARLPYYGVPVSTEGQEHIPSSVGPLTRSLASLTVIMREVINTRPWEHDARCVPLPWKDSVFREFAAKKLTIGLLVDDGVVRPHPSVTRVLLSLVQRLREAGHDVVDWNADLHAECIQVQDEFYTVDGGEDVRRDVLAGGEPFIPHVEALINRGSPVSVYDYWQLNKRKVELQQAYLRKWKSIKSTRTGNSVDIILMPVMPHTAVPHRSCRWVGYTKVWNMLDYTALTIPAGKAEAIDKQSTWDHTLRNGLDEWNAELWTKHKDTMIDLGLPVGVQIIGRKLEEEKVLAVGSIIDQLVLCR